MHAVVVAARVVVVVVTKRFHFLALTLCLLSSAALEAAVLPEDRADVLSHSYEGGGMDITGPSVLVRKGDDKSFSVFANYYVDNISSASIDVQSSGASTYKEERTEQSVGLDYLYGKSIMSLSYTNSEELDYVANSYHFGLSMDMFGDLTTVSMGVSRGQDEVYKSTKVDGVKQRDPDFKKDVDRRHYRLGLSQILTKNMILALNFETITDEGYLNNPYRSVRYKNGPDSTNSEAEKYPATRTSNAASGKIKYFLPWRAAVHAEGRIYADDWGIRARDSKLGLTQPIGEHWIAELRYRFYSQTKADFYNDLFEAPSTDELDFRARDKELSSFYSKTIGLGLSYEFAKSGWGFVDKASVNLVYDRVEFTYEDFRDIRVSGTIGQEPFYQFSANILQLFVSMWY